MRIPCPSLVKQINAMFTLSIINERKRDVCVLVLRNLAAFSVRLTDLCEKSDTPNITIHFLRNGRQGSKIAC